MSVRREEGDFLSIVAIVRSRQQSDGYCLPVNARGVLSNARAQPVNGYALPINGYA